MDLTRLKRLIFSLFLITSSMTFLMVILKSAVSPLFGVYKESFCILIIFISLFEIYKLNKISLTFIASMGFSLVAFFSIFISELYNSLPIFNYIYEMKIFFFYFILFTSMTLLCSTYKSTEDNIKLATKVFLIFSIINVIFSIVQRYYFSDVIASFGFESSVEARDSFGSENSIVIQTQNGLFRTIGTFSAPMVLAEYLMFSTFLFSLKAKDLMIKIVWISLSILAIYFTSYKTVLMYLPAVILLSFLNTRYRKVTTASYCFFLLIFGFLATHTHIVYNVVYPFHQVYAEYSVRLRIEFLFDVFSQMDNIWKLLFGVGYGYNGGFLGYFEDSVPLDSIYIWMLSNYGFVGVIVFLMLIVFLYNYKPFPATGEHEEIFYSCKDYIVLVVCANFFWNNIFINYPSFLFPLLFLILYYNLIVQKNRLLN